MPLSEKNPSSCRTPMAYLAKGKRNNGSNTGTSGSGQLAEMAERQITASKKQGLRFCLVLELISACGRYPTPSNTTNPALNVRLTLISHGECKFFLPLRRLPRFFIMRQQSSARAKKNLGCNMEHEINATTKPVEIMPVVASRNQAPDLIYFTHCNAQSTPPSPTEPHVPLTRRDQVQLHHDIKLGACLVRDRKPRPTR